MTARMRAPVRLIAGLLIAGGAVAAMASQPAVTPGPAPTQEDEPFQDAATRATIVQAMARLDQGDCAGALGLLDPVASRVSGKDGVAVELMRIPCLGGAGRAAEIPAIYDRIATVDPANPGVRSVGVVVAAQRGEMPLAARRLTELAEQNPKALGAITSPVGRSIMQDLAERRDEATRKRLFVALARADWQPVDRPEMRDGLAQGAIEALLADRQVDEAAALLPRITMPELLTSMAIERLYEPLWPEIERRLGPQGGLAVDRFALSRLEAFTRSEGDERARRDAIRAFVLLGRYPEAIELGEKVAIADGMSEEAVTSVRYHAQALAAAGRRDQAIARMRPFERLDLAKTPPAASGLIGLAELLDEHGRGAEALATARTGLARGSDAVSPWGRAWLRRTEVCALTSIGRGAEARPIVDQLIAGARENEAATVEALLCAGRGDDAARVAIAALGTQQGTSAIADQFQPDGSIWAPAGSRLRGLWTPFLARADVKAAFDRSARILPRTLWPSRTPRAIPRRGTDEPGAIT